jgi:hypothetical protein
MTYRFRRGNHYASKLNPEQVFEIRRKYNEEGMTQGMLAREYGMNISTIGNIVRGESWAHSAIAPPRMLSDEELAALAERSMAVQREVDAQQRGATPSSAPAPSNAAPTAEPSPYAELEARIAAQAERYGASPPKR